ncbi:alcohol dehydrogenase family protein [Roseovarius sp. EL26]|uniref:alcohol dehydrogenase family protein n=1 Tax=Roseovarius sp. EL26 TaxID=2126672 RepID=UPI001C1FF8FE|nr:alcohol dehydrogenase family protein [Roseovarius sp. EL26]
MTDLPQTMKAMVLMGHGDLDQYQWHEDWPIPTPGPMDVVIKVGACGLNNTDVNTRTGWYSKAVDEATTGGAYGEINEDDPTWGGAPLTFPRIQGADAVGKVVSVGAEADASLIGKRVLIEGWIRDWNDPSNMDKTGYFGSEKDGGYAEFTMADARDVAPIECDLTDAELATFQCSYTTAEGMLVRANVGEGDTVLIPGASGGVGGALIQLAKRRGARVIAMASEAKHADVQKCGPDVLLPRSPENLRDALGDEKITVVADIVGGPIWPQLIDVLERGGRYTCAGAIAGPMVEFDLRTFYLRDLTFTGSTILPTHVLRDVVSYIERGEVKPMLAETFPLSQLREAQTAFIEKRHTGNIVVLP